MKPFTCIPNHVINQFLFDHGIEMDTKDCCEKVLELLEKSPTLPLPEEIEDWIIARQIRDRLPIMTASELYFSNISSLDLLINLVSSVATKTSVFHKERLLRIMDYSNHLADDMALYHILPFDLIKQIAYTLDPRSVFLLAQVGKGFAKLLEPDHLRDVLRVVLKSCPHLNVHLMNLNQLLRICHLQPFHVAGGFIYEIDGRFVNQSKGVYLTDRIADRYYQFMWKKIDYKDSSAMLYYGYPIVINNNKVVWRGPALNGYFRYLCDDGRVLACGVRQVFIHIPSGKVVKFLGGTIDLYLTNEGKVWYGRGNNLELLPIDDVVDICSLLDSTYFHVLTGNGKAYQCEHQDDLRLTLIDLDKRVILIKMWIDHIYLSTEDGGLYYCSMVNTIPKLIPRVRHVCATSGEGGRLAFLTKGGRIFSRTMKHSSRNQVKLKEEIIG